MEIKISLISEVEKMDQYKALFFNLNYLDQNQIQLQQGNITPSNQLIFSQKSLVLSSEQLQSFFTSKTSQIGYTSTNISFLLNSIINIELFGVQSIQELNPKEKSQDLTMTYVETKHIPMYDFLLSDTPQQITIKYLEQNFTFEIQVIMEQKIDFNGSTIGNLQFSLLNFADNLFQQGFTYVAQCRMSNCIKFSQYIELVEGQTQASEFQHYIFPSYKHLFDQAAIEVVQFQENLKIEASSKSPKPGTVSQTIKVYQDPLEYALLNRKICLNYNYYLFYSSEDRTEPTNLFESEIELYPDLSEKVKVQFKKTTDKSPYQSQSMSPFIWPDFQNISRKQLYSSLELESKDPANFIIRQEFKFEGLDIKQSLTISDSFYLPFDEELIKQSILNESDIPPVRGKKDPKQDPFALYPNGTVNRIWSNEICGIKTLLSKISYSIPNINQMTQNTPFVQSLIDNYTKEIKNIEIAHNVIKQLYKLLEMEQLSKNDYYKPIKSSISIDFKFPIVLKQIKIKESQDIQYIKNYLINTFKADMTPSQKIVDYSAIKNTTISFVQDLQDKFFLSSVSQSSQESGTTENVAQQKALKKLQINKQYALRGIQGISQQKATFIPTSVNREQQLDFSQFGQIIQGDGMVDMLQRQLLPVLYEYLQQGFPTKKDMINYLVTLVSSQVSEDVFLELQERKNQQNQLREEKEKAELQQLASSKNQKSRPNSTKPGQPSRPSSSKTTQDDEKARNIGKMFKSIKINDELSNALLKIHNQLELEKKLKQEERDLTVKINEQSPEQQQNAKSIKSSLYLTAVDNKRFSDIAFKKIQGVLARIIPQSISMSIPAQISNLQKSLLPEQISELLTSYLISGLKLSQPHQIESLEDANRLKKYLYQPTSLVEQMVFYEPELISSEVAILTICNIVNQQYYNITENKHQMLDELLFDEDVIVNEEKSDVDQHVNQNVNISSLKEIPKLNIQVEEDNDENITKSQTQRSVESSQVNSSQNSLQIRREKLNHPIRENQSIIKLFQQLLDQSEYFLLNILQHYNLGSNEKYKPTEMKHDILNRLLDRNFRSSDVNLILEILGVPELEEKLHQYNTILKTEMIVNKDETGKKINKTELLVEEAEQKEVVIDLQQVPEWIIGGFIFILYYKNILSAKTISGCISDSIKKLITKYDEKFRQLIEKVQELDVANSLNDSQTVAQAPLQPLKRNNSMLSNNTSFSQGGINTLTQQIYQKMKSIRTSLSMAKFQTQHQLSAIQEYLINDSPIFNSVLPTVDKFDNENQFISHIIDSTIPKTQIKAGSQTKIVQKISLLISLAEFLSIRSETHISAVASDLSQKLMLEQSNIDNSSIQHLFIRSHFISLRKLFNEQKYGEVMNYIEQIRQGEFGQRISNRIKTCPQFSFLKAKSLYYLKNQQQLSVQEGNLLNQEIFKHAYNAYLQANKVREFDDFSRGSTSIGEASYFDLGFSYNLLETMLLSIGILDYLKPNQQSQELPQHNNLVTDTAFLREQKANLEVMNLNLNDELVINYDDTDLLDENEIQLLQAKQFSKPISVESFLKKKQELLTNGGDKKMISPDKKLPSAKQHLKSQQSDYSSTVPITNFITTDQDVEEKDKTKTLFIMASAIKQFLEQNPGFGPAWSLYALLQLTLSNMTDARLSSSIATVLNPEVVDCWATWACCEILNANDQENIKWLLNQFKEQIVAMGVEDSKVEWLWSYAMEFIEKR